MSHSPERECSPSGLCNRSAEKGKPLSPEDNAQHARAAKRGRGRPRIRKGAEKIYISMERGLLKKADAYAKRHGMTRSELTNRQERAGKDRDRRMKNLDSVIRIEVR